MKTKVADSNRLCSQIWLGQLRNKDDTTKSIKICRDENAHVLELCAKISDEKLKYFALHQKRPKGASEH